MLEKILFNLIAISILVIVISKIVKHKNGDYVYIVTIGLIGIMIHGLSIITKIELPIGIIVLCWILSVVFPIAMIIMEIKKFYFTELLTLTKMKIYKNDPNKLKALLLKATQKCPNSYYCHKKLAQIYEKENNLDMALDEYMIAQENNKKDYDTTFKIAKLYDLTNRMEKAEEVLNDLLNKKPDFIEASLLLSEIYYNNDQFQKSISVCEKAMKYNNLNYELNYYMGMAYARLNDFQTAENYYNTAAQINSLAYNAKFGLAQIYMIQNKINEAEIFFSQCVQDEKLEDLSYYYLAYISKMKSQNEMAKKYLEVAIEKNPLLYDKAKEEPLFTEIIKSIGKPIQEKIDEYRNKEKKNKANLDYELKLKYKNEEKTLEHLEKSYKIIRTNNYEKIR